MAEKNYHLVKAYIRQRPQTKEEIELKAPSIVHKTSTNEIILKSGRNERKLTFDQVFTDKTSQEEVYNVVVYPLMDSIISGYNCTVFAYGQTGTGKTHTMIGNSVGPHIDFKDDGIGMIPRAASHLFRELNKFYPKVQYTVLLSFIEIYNEEVRDLLISDSTQLKIYDDRENKGSVRIKELREVTVCNVEEVHEWLNIGIMERHTASTNLNRQSSRSHTIFTLQVHTKETVEGQEIMKTGKLNLIDLAGSENIGRSGATDMRAREAGTINKSLLTLGKVIKSLAQKQQHIPYRESKLTRILQDSLGGKTKTSMIATFSSCYNSWEETLSTLDYAHVVRSVANCPTVNINRKQSNVLSDLKEEIRRLRHELSAARTGTGFYVSQENFEKMSQELKTKRYRVQNLMVEVQRLEEYRRLKEEQYQELEGSFKKTKNHLDSVSEKLEENKAIEKEKKYVLNYMNRINGELTKTNALLMNVCETSTKHGEIYHKKYDDQCDSTVANANIARNMCSLSANYVKDMLNASDNLTETQRNHLSEIGPRVHCLQNTNKQNLEELNTIALALQSNTANHKLNLNEIFKNQTESTQNYCKALFGNAYLQNHDKIKINVDVLKAHVVAKSREVQNHAENNVQKVERCSAAEGIYVDSSRELLENIYKSIAKRHEQIQLDVAAKRKMRHSVREYLQKMKESEKEVLAETARIRDQIDGVSALIKNYENVIDNLDNARGALADYHRSQSENTKTTVSLSEDVVGAAEKTENCKHETLADKAKTQQHFTELITTTKTDLNNCNSEFIRKLDSTGQQIDLLRKCSLQATEEHVNDINNSVEGAASARNKYNCDVKQFVRQSTEELQSVKNNIVSTSHSGDTPLKQTYSYPKKILKSLPEQILIERFNNAGDQSPI